MKQSKRKLQVEKLKKQNENLGYRNRIDAVIADSYEAHDNTFGKSPSNRAKKAIINYATNKQTAQEKEGLRCFKCTWSTDPTNSMMWQIDRLTYHVKHFHDYTFTEEEAKELAELIK